MKKLLALLIASSVGLSGCAQLPRDSAIGIGPDVASQNNGDFVYYSLSLPAKDASKEDIMSGFLSAGTGPQDDYAIARSYLTIKAQADWLPSEEVLIQDGSPTLTWLADGFVTVDVKISASINAAGVYQPAPAGSLRRLVYKLAKENGQWRVSEAPNLTMLIHPNFKVLFKPYSVYFFDSAHRFLVPDVRWFPSRSSTATHLVNARLGGAQDWLKPALADAEPKFALNTDAVTVTDGTANVDLSDSAFDATTDQMRYLKAELKATLLQLNSVTAVNISIGRNSQDIADIPAQVAASPAGAPLALTQAGISQIDSQEEVFSMKQLLPLVAGEVTDFAVSETKQSVAVRTSRGVYRITKSALGLDSRIVDLRRSLLEPRWDNRDWLWSVGSETNQNWLVSDANGSRMIDVASIRGSKVKGFEVSPDGARVVMLLSGKRNGVWVAAVVRNSLGRPVSIAEPTNMFIGEGMPFSASWMDSTHLAILTRVPSKDVRPLVLTIGGEKEWYPIINGGASIIGSLLGPDIYVLRDDKTVMRSRSGIWSQVQTEVLAMHYPGR